MANRPYLELALQGYLAARTAKIQDFHEFQRHSHLAATATSRHNRHCAANRPKPAPILCPESKSIPRRDRTPSGHSGKRPSPNSLHPGRQPNTNPIRRYKPNAHSDRAANHAGGAESKSRPSANACANGHKAPARRGIRQKRKFPVLAPEKLGDRLPEAREPIQQPQRWLENALRCDDGNGSSYRYFLGP